MRGIRHARDVPRGQAGQPGMCLLRITRRNHTPQTPLCRGAHNTFSVSSMRISGVIHKREEKKVAKKRREKKIDSDFITIHLWITSSEHFTNIHLLFSFNDDKLACG